MLASIMKRIMFSCGAFNFILANWVLNSHGRSLTIFTYILKDTTVSVHTYISFI